MCCAVLRAFWFVGEHALTIFHVHQRPVVRWSDSTDPQASRAAFAVADLPNWWNVVPRDFGLSVSEMVHRRGAGAVPRRGALARTASRARVVEGVPFGADAKSLAVRLRLCVTEYTAMCRSLKVRRTDERLVVMLARS